jgi:hypothetical protein
MMMMMVTIFSLGMESIYLSMLIIAGVRITGFGIILMDFYLTLLVGTLVVGFRWFGKMRD